MNIDFESIDKENTSCVYERPYTEKENEDFHWKNCTAMKIGPENTVQHRVFFLSPEGSEISPMNEIPLYTNDCVNYLCTTPKTSHIVYEMELSEPVPSLKPLLSHGKTKALTQPSKWNFGILPQTWSDPSTILKGEYKSFGYNGQPLELIEISKSQAAFGEVRSVKPVAAFSTTHGRELAWHIIAISAEDYGTEIHCMNELVGEICEVREWLKTCFCGQDFENMRSIGKEECLFSFDAIDDVIDKAHLSWRQFTQAKGETNDNSDRNYSHNVWANYVSHEGSRIFCTEPKPNQHKLSGLLWEEAHVCDQRRYSIDLGVGYERMPVPLRRTSSKLNWSESFRKSIGGPSELIASLKKLNHSSSVKSSSVVFSPKELSPSTTMSPKAREKSFHKSDLRASFKGIESMVKKWHIACLYAKVRDEA